MAGIVYNVTIKIDTEVAPQWLDWMLSEHIPEVMATACFSSYKLLHLEGYDDEEGLTYAIQYTCPNPELLEIYQRDHAPALQARHKERYEGRFAAFRTLLRILSES